MLEKYYEYKSEYDDFVIFIKAGSFYEVLEKDALIVSKLLNYKIKKFSRTVKCGFPVYKLDDVLNVMTRNRINYLVIDNDFNKVVFNDNKYLEYAFDINKIMLNFLRIDKITKYLNDNVLSDDITNVLDKIEGLL